MSCFPTRHRPRFWAVQHDRQRLGEWEPLPAEQHSACANVPIRRLGLFCEWEGFQQSLGRLALGKGVDQSVQPSVGNVPPSQDTGGALILSASARASPAANQASTSASRAARSQHAVARRWKCLVHHASS